MQRHDKFQTIQLYTQANNSSILVDKTSSIVIKHSHTMKKPIQKFNPQNGNYSQEYERLQQNGRIIKRIIHPKRDKIILRSIQIVKNLPRNATCHEYRARSEQSNRKSFHIGRQTTKSTFNTFSMQDFKLKQENERMGRRIINTKSMVRSMISDNSIHRLKSSTNSKINKGVIAFFQDKVERQQSQRRQLNKQNLLPNMKQYYGFGPTILNLSKINIATNPSLKNDDLIFLELLVNNVNSKLYRTQLIPYHLLCKMQLKFALRLKKVGEFVPLRFWKVVGVNTYEIGIVDIQFSSYLLEDDTMQRDEIKTQQRQLLFNFKNRRTVKKNKQGKIRTIIAEKLNCKLRKTRVEEVQGQISMEYLIYRKKYV